MQRVQRYEEHDDYVTGLVSVPHKKMILSSSGDGYLSVYDYRKSELIARSDNFEDELTGLALAKGGRKIIASSVLSCLHIFSWGIWGDETDRFPKHPGAIQCLQSWDQNHVITGSSDGQIRVIQILPNRIVDESQVFESSVEAVSHNDRYIAAITHDTQLAIIQKYVSENADDDHDDDDDDDEKEADDDTNDDDEKDSFDSDFDSEMELDSAVKITNAKNSFFDDLLHDEE